MTMIALGPKSALLLMLVGSSWAMDESAASSSQQSSAPSSSAMVAAAAAAAADQRNKQHYGSIFDEPEQHQQQLIGDKRAYTYRSEFKRLPLYQFGLGKRLVQSIGDKRGQPFSFGLGKRIGKQYDFGLGKRSASRYDEAEALRMNGNSPTQLDDIYAERLLENYLAPKRANNGGFNFGLGKRDSEMGSFLRDYDLQDRLPVKHSRDNLRYQFGLGKRGGRSQQLQEDNGVDDDSDDGNPLDVADLFESKPQLMI